MIRAGSSWCDLVKHADGRVEFVSLVGSHVTCDLRWSVNAGQPLLYLRAAADGNGRVCAIGQGQHDGQAWATIEGGAPVDLGGTHGVFPVLIFGDSLGWVAYLQRTPSTYDVVRLHSGGGHVRLATREMPPTSQGFLYVGPDGQPVTQDAGRNRIFGLALPSPAGDVWAGQSMVAPTIAIFDGDAGQIAPLWTPGGQPPHIVESGGTYFVCSYVDGGAWLSTHRRPFTAATPPIEPPPVTPPEETPVRLEQKHSDLIEAFAARFTPPGHDEDALRDHWTPKLVEQFVFSFPNEGWCWKSTSQGSRPSSDVIARQVSGGMWGYDLIPGAGTSGWSLNSHPGPIDLRTQAPIRMNPVNHLGAQQPPVNPPTQPPVPPPSTSLPLEALDTPWDVEVDILTRFRAGIHPRDRVHELTDTGLVGSGTMTRGSLAFLLPAQLRVTVAWVQAHGNRAPRNEEWWQLAAPIADAAVADYLRAHPMP